MRKKILKEGEYVRVMGKVTIYSPYKKVNGRWVGGSSWTVKNPLIRLGKCKHKPVEKNWFTNISREKISCKGQIECSDCGQIIKLGKQFMKLRK